MRHVWEIESSSLVIRVYRRNHQLYEFQACTHGGWAEYTDGMLVGNLESRSEVMKKINDAAKACDCETVEL